MNIDSKVAVQHSLTYRVSGLILIGGIVTVLSWSAASMVVAGYKSPGALIFGVLVGAVVLLVAAVRPIVAAVAALGLTFVNPSLLPTLVNIGDLSLRFVDVTVFLLMFFLLMRTAVHSGVNISSEFWRLLVPLFPFLGYVGLSLITVGATHPGHLAASVASYLRLLTTVFFALVLYLSVSSERDLKFLWNSFKVYAAITIIEGLGEALLFPLQGESALVTYRFGGLLGKNAFGLVSGLVILYAFTRKNGRLWSLPSLSALFLGLVGISLSKSASSILATGGAVASYMIFSRFPGRRRYNFIVRMAAGVALAGGTAAAAIWFFRRTQVLQLLNLSGGSFALRLALAYAGFNIFLRHPLIGVGWQASTGSAIIETTVSAVFPGLPEKYSLFLQQTSVHNMYVQILAELGILGILLFAMGCFWTARAIRSVIKKVPAESVNYPVVKFCAYGLLFVLIWWNTNPLYGGEIETVAVVTFLSTLASVARIERKLGRTRQLGGLECREKDLR